MKEPTEMELKLIKALKIEVQRQAEGTSRCGYVNFRADNEAIFDTSINLHDLVRAVIRAMREPTPEMYDRANRIESKSKSDLKSFDVTGFCALAYIAMIDAASPPDTAEL